MFFEARRTIEPCKSHIFMEYIDVYPPSRQIRREVESLLSVSTDYDLFGQRYLGKAKNYSHTFFQMRREQDWIDVFSLFLKNRNRPLRDTGFFEPCRVRLRESIADCSRPPVAGFPDQ